MRIFLIFLLILVPSCTTTVIPTQVKSNTASFDSGVQNSGFIQFNADGSAAITPHARDRYNLLIGKYSKKFLPPLKKDDGVSEWIVIHGAFTYRITPEAIVHFKQMNQWFHSGQ
jgi:hypothetical protein